MHYSFRSFSQGKRSQGFIQRRQQNFDSNILELKLAMEEDGLKVHELDHDTNVDEFLLDQGTISVSFHYLLTLTCAQSIPKGIRTA